MKHLGATIVAGTLVFAVGVRRSAAEDAAKQFTAASILLLAEERSLPVS